MLRRGVLGALALAVLLTLVAAGCGSKKSSSTTTAATVTTKPKKAKEGPTAPCGPADPAMSGKPTFPAGFPTPAAVVYTKQKQIGPSKATFGFRPGGLRSMESAWKAALPPAGYKVTKAEIDFPADSEVNFAGHGVTGQVRMVQRCATRTSLTIIIRPK